MTGKFILGFTILAAAGILLRITTEDKTFPTTTTLPRVGFATTPKETVVKNLDASKQIILMEDTAGANSTVYTLYVADTATGNRQLLYAKTVPKDVTISVPQNSWSPDSTYVFIKEQSNGTTFLVFRADTEAFATGDQFIDVLSNFTQNVEGAVLSDVTGWDGNGLLHVKTATAVGGRGPSYWFDISSRAFLLLAR